MAVECRVLVLADYSAAAPGQKPLVVGMFDIMFCPRSPTEPSIALPRFHLFAAFECPTMDGAQHLIAVRILDDDGKEVLTSTLGLVFSARVSGRGLSAYLSFDYMNLRLPDFGDYVFEVWSDGRRLNSTSLAVLPIGERASVAPT